MYFIGAVKVRIKHLPQNFQKNIVSEKVVEVKINF